MKNIVQFLFVMFCLFTTTKPLHAQWIQTNGPYGGSVHAFAVSGTNLFAGTKNGVFLSTNNGTSWTLSLMNNSVYALAVNGTNLFAGTGGGGVFLSINNGATWRAVNNGMVFSWNSVNTLFVSGTNLFAATTVGSGGFYERVVYLSTNNGASWRKANYGLPSSTVQAFAVIGTNLFAGTGSGVFLSSNNGTSWTVNYGMSVNAFAISPTSGGAGGTNLFAGTDSGAFLSTNNGTSWTAVNTGLTNIFVKTFAVSPTAGGSGTNLFAGTDGGVFLSANNGTSWTAVNTGLTKTMVYALAVNGTYLFAGIYSDGVFLSTNNGTNWTATGLKYTSVPALAVSPANGGTGGTNLFAGTGSGVFLSTNNGTSWSAVNTGLTNLNVTALAVSPAAGGTGTNLFAGTSNSGVFLSTNNGISWTAVNTGLTNTYVQFLTVSGTNLFAGTNGGVFLSTDNGASWSAVNTGLPDISVYSVYALAVSPASSGAGGTNFFAGTYGGGVFLSTNNGTSWTAVNTGLTYTGVSALAVSGTNLFAGTYSGGVWRRPLSEMTTVINKPVFSLSKVQLSFGRVKTGTAKKDSVKVSNPGTDTLKVSAVSSTNQSFTFAPSTMRLAPTANAYLVINFAPQDTLDKTGFIILTHNADGSPDSIAVSGKGLLTAIEDETSIPTEYELSQNYPNPFNATTTINYQLPMNGKVTLKVYDMLGREVQILVNESQNAGNYSVRFSATDLPSGMYFYRLQSGSYAETKKLILMK